jgi:hypothetical protein
MTFYGSDLSLEEADRVGMLIDEEHRVAEAELFSTKWFDYRRMHPVVATYRFAHDYSQAALRFYTKTCSAEPPRSLLVTDDVFEHRAVTSFWLARQCADRVGCPYTYMLDYAAERFFDRHFSSYPQPNQLYGEEFELDLADRWRVWNDLGVRYSRDPETVGTPEHQAWVIERIARYRVKAGVLARMLNEGVLTPEVIERHFGETELKHARRQLDFLNR